ncbi:ABC transporter permease [Acidimangrovimonas sediminis]|uniref:ABC transporter permease n=1 Tax=Acidimangrovimonas sediminis TaxID=2056283 RepID=UPI000C80724D|nr:ABC transporter permease [Acidimangrovimonas sediminis]
MQSLLPKLGRLYVIAVFAFIFLPLILVLLISFSTDDYLNFPPHGWGLRYYHEVLGNANFMAGIRNSAIIAAIVMVLSLAFGLPAAYALTRLNFAGRDFLRSFVLAPLILPTIVLGLGILMIFTQLHLTATYPGLVLAHLVMTLPFTVRILQTTLGNLGTEVEQAAMTLGARPLQTFRYITLPRLVPGLVAAGAISAILSFDEVVLSLFIVGPRLTTLPVAIYRYVDERTDPMVAVLAVLLIAVSLGIVLIVERSVGFARAFGR